MPAQSLSSRISFLDGWRAVSVLFVMLSHGAGALDMHNAILAEVAKLGVFVFFVISGYVITRTSLAELQKTGYFSRRNFIIRRALRILPPLFLYVAFIIFIGAIEPANWQAPLRALSFTCNTAIPFGSCGWIFGHTWSLAFEEQFYLLFPFLFLRKFSLVAAAALAIALMPLLFPIPWIGRLTYFHAVALLTLGCLYAAYDARVDVAIKKIPTILVLSLPAIIVTSFAVVAGPLRLIAASLLPIAILLLIFELPKRVGIIHAVLSSRPLTQIGLYSYSIYLWQQFFLMPGSASSIASVATSMFWVTIVAAVSYHSYEAFFRNVSRRIILKDSKLP
jgi:peptidoglycan/LPS O-acetylase OafA/YrhL